MSTPEQPDDKCTGPVPNPRRFGAAPAPSITELQAQVEQLTQERDQLLHEAATCMEFNGVHEAVTEIVATRARAEALTLRVTRLAETWETKAKEPFHPFIQQTLFNCADELSAALKEAK